MRTMIATHPAISSRLLSLALTVLALACSARKESSEEPFAAQQPLDLTPQVSTSQEVDWRSIFKPAPNMGERQAIQKKLESWKDSGETGALLEKARAEVALGKLTLAEATLRQALRRNDNNPETALELAQLYVRKHDGERAISLLTQIRSQIRTDDRNQSATLYKYRFTLALAYLEKGDRNNANSILTDLIGRSPKFSAAFAALSSSYLSAGKYEIAEFVARRGLDRGNEDASLYSTMGLAIERQGRQEEARQVYDRGLTINGTHVPSLVNRGSLAIRQGDCKEGSEYLGRALLYAPNEANAWVGLGVCHRRAQKIDQARASFAKAVELDPDNGTARFNLALLLRDDLKQPGEAARLLREVVQSSQENQHLAKMAAKQLRDTEQDRETESAQ